MRYLFLASVLFALSAPSSAQEGGEPAVDGEQVSQDLLKNVDGWIGQVNEKLQSDKPVTSEDFDAVFNESSFSNSDDPVRDLDLAQKQLNEKIGAGGKEGKELDAAYNSWLVKRLAPEDLSPRTVSDAEHVTVTLKAPDAGPVKAAVSRGRIKLSYYKLEPMQDLQQDGSVTTSYYKRRVQRVMAVPKGADPAKYRVKTAEGAVTIIFDRLKETRRSRQQEASK